MTRALLIVAIVVLGLASACAAPRGPTGGAAAATPAGPPDLSGSWTLNADATRPNAFGFCGNACTIEQTVAALVVRFPEREVRYPINAAEERALTQSGGDPVEIISSAAWSGAALVFHRIGRNVRTGVWLDRSIKVFLEDGRLIVESAASSKSLDQQGRQTYQRASP
jgi:hypothetical protein